MVHESQMHEFNCSLTLTYDNDHIPEDGSLAPRDHQTFIKRLRKLYNFRFFHCGEYGEENGRPHYHTMLFGVDFPDKRLSNVSRSGHPLYRSELLESVWRNGLAFIGNVTFESCQYAAKYTTKIVNVSKSSTKEAREKWSERYERVNPLTGEIIDVKPEYCTMSNRPGIGKPWFDRFYREVYPMDEVIANGHPIPPPRYYDTLLERTDPELFERVKRARIENRDRRNDSEDRLAAMEKVAISRNSMFGAR